MKLKALFHFLFFVVLVCAVWIASVQSKPSRTPTTRQATKRRAIKPPNRTKYQQKSAAALWNAARPVSKKYGCLRCHSTDGTDGMGPTLLGLHGTYATLHDGKKRLRNRAFFRQKIKFSSRLELAGNRNIMPNYESISDKELHALVEWIVSLRRKAGKRRGQKAGKK